MKMDIDTKLEIFGFVIEGWKATFIVILLLGILVGLGFQAGISLHN
jgi:hypothetical protein